MLTESTTYGLKATDWCASHAPLCAAAVAFFLLWLAALRTFRRVDGPICGFWSQFAFGGPALVWSLLVALAVTAYFGVFLGAVSFAIIPLFLAALRTFLRVDDPNCSWLNWLAFGSPALIWSLVVSVAVTAAVLDAADRRLNAVIAEDADRLGQHLTARTQQRLFNIIAFSARDLTGEVGGRGPEWAILDEPLTADELTRRLNNSQQSLVELKGRPAWALVYAILNDARRGDFKRLEDIEAYLALGPRKTAPSGVTESKPPDEPTPKSPTPNGQNPPPTQKEPADKWRKQQELILDRVPLPGPDKDRDKLFEDILPVATRLFVQRPGTGPARTPLPPVFSRAALTDLVAVFEFSAEGFFVRPWVAAFVRKPWINTREENALVAAVAEPYVRPSYWVLGSEPQPTREERVRNLWFRLGTSYSEPSPRDVANRLASAMDRVKQDRGNQEGVDRVFDMAAAAALVGQSREDARQTVPPDLYDRPPGTMKELLGKQLYGEVQATVCAGVEYGVGAADTGEQPVRPFTLGVTPMRLRTMIRGEIQFVTFVFFAWGLFILVWVGTVRHLLGQLVYLLAPTRGLPPATPDEVTWADVWLAGRGKTPVAVAIAAGGGRSPDLFPRLLAAGLSNALAGGSLANTDAEIERANKEWQADYAHQFYFVDFVAWVLPALGFLGTVVGIGQGMAMANRVQTQDADELARRISDMTGYLGTAFFTTLVALVCVIPYTFISFVISRGRDRVALLLKARAREYVLARFDANPISTPPDSGDALENGSKDVSSQLTPDVSGVPPLIPPQHIPSVADANTQAEGVGTPASPPVCKKMESAPGSGLGLNGPIEPPLGGVPGETQ